MIDCHDPRINSGFVCRRLALFTLVMTRVMLWQVHPEQAASLNHG